MTCRCRPEATATHREPPAVHEQGPRLHMNPTDSPFWQAARPIPRAMCVLPVPLLPTAITFSRRVAYSERASSRTRVLLSRGIAAKSKLSEAFDGQEPRFLDSTLYHASLSIRSAPVRRGAGESGDGRDLQQRIAEQASHTRARTSAA